MERDDGIYEFTDFTDLRIGRVNDGSPLRILPIASVREYAGSAANRSGALGNATDRVNPARGMVAAMACRHESKG
jgi:hypothetical protein